MNKRAKGNRIEREFMQVLKDSGRFVEIWKPCHCRGNSDIFGLFDIMALDEYGSIHLFQIKSNPSDYSKAKKTIKKFAHKFKCSGKVYAYVLLRLKKSLWRIIEYGIDEIDKYDGEYYINDKFEEVDKDGKK